ncbi:dol-P-Man:Man(7)GlcNAc(2)-PP-Dol alpha-1,6-mannosyltransferase [Leptidea sinapis]|uniref:dol-P-Man:Man(7)GlcNAc(2)-PP-Dol alpha-1,6-mannosyltransferase n=1 Tax=Leptidea sinapis TaxID=189913 RepID=UPI0021C2FAEA|nr:dol-P-Man:Man(7)GlcNAc(2)-PP-Dol alpha-1,6-mannosyltransferase [Leptidea sinapis]
MVQLLYIVSSLHVLLCPFTKVEESFNIQAFHDILYHRFNLSQYDHNDFPGVVPRTFIGPLAISALSSPVVGVLYLLGINKFWTQYVVRLTLALTVIAAWSRLRNTLQKLFGSTFAWWFTIITVSQYHFMFYLSRPLPNIMAMPMVLFSLDGWLSGRRKQFVVSAGAAIVIFRSELALLFGLFLLIDFYFKKINIVELMKIVIPSGIGLILFTVTVDSIFWGRLLWPEAEVFWFNTVLNKSSEWGTSPFLWYFYSALPRGLGPSIVLVPVGLYLDRRLLQIVAPALVYILLFSFLPHKELRFIIYVFPLLNVASAVTCSYIYIRRSKAPIYELLFWGSVLLIVCNLIFTTTLVLVAMSNYPGGVAMTRFHKLLKHEPYVHLHISNLAAQTGVTRFTQIQDHWMYSKNESLSTNQLQHFTHLLVEAKSKYSPSIKAFVQTHDILDSVESFSQIAVSYRLIPPIKIKTKQALFILERRKFRDDPQPAFNDVISDDDENKQFINEGEMNVYNYEEGDTAPDEFVPNQKAANSDEIADVVSNSEENVSHENFATIVDDEETLAFRKEIEDSIANIETPQTNTRYERKMKAIAKIKSETRKEVVASAKEKLKEIMRRHKDIAKELSDNDISNKVSDIDKETNRGDIPETEELEDINTNSESIPINNIEDNQSILENQVNINAISEEADPNNIIINRTEENIDSIVEEVIHRLIDRKIYDDKTKPDDIKIEDRRIIQKIVEEILSERMNYSKSDIK